MQSGAITVGCSATSPGSAPPTANANGGIPGRASAETLAQRLAQQTGAKKGQHDYWVFRPSSLFTHNAPGALLFALPPDVETAEWKTFSAQLAKAGSDGLRFFLAEACLCFIDIVGMAGSFVPAYDGKWFTWAPRLRAEMKKGKRKKPVLSDEVQSEMMTVREVAEYLNCHFFTVYRLIHQNALPGFRLGGDRDWRFRRSDVDQWIAARQVQPPPSAAKKPNGRGRRKPKS